MECGTDDSGSKDGSITNEAEIYKWLFLYISLTEKQRDELHNPSSRAHSEVYNSTVKSQKKNLNYKNNRKRSNIKQNANYSKQKRPNSTLLNDDSTDSIHNIVSSNSRPVNSSKHSESNKTPIFLTKASRSYTIDILNDLDTHSHTRDSSKNSTNDCNSNQPLINQQIAGLLSSKHHFLEKINNIVNSSNYEKYINTDNFMDIITKLKSRFRVNFITPIWNDTAISMKLRLKIVLPPPNFYHLHLEEDKWYKELKSEMNKTKDPEKKEWISRLLRYKCIEVTFMIRDGGINSSYKSALKFRNYFYEFANESLSKNNVIVIGNKKQDPNLVKFDVPIYFKNRDEINLTNSIRLLKFGSLLNLKLNRFIILTRYRKTQIRIELHDQVVYDDKCKSGVKVKKVKLTRENLFSSDTSESIKQSVPVKNKILITNHCSNSKRGWDMKRLKMCIVDPPPLPEYCTSSLNLAHINNSNKDSDPNPVSNFNNNTVNGTELESNQNVGQNNNPNATQNNSNAQLTNPLNSTKHNNPDVHNNLNTNAAEQCNSDKINEFNQNDVYDYKNFTQMSNNEKFDVIIVGAGVGGLGAANYLSKKGLKVAVIEARNRIGGRMFTTYFPKITLDSHSHSDVVANLFNRYDNKYDTKKYFTLFNEDCTNLPEMNIDLGPNYLHCNNLFFNPKDQSDSSEPNVMNGVEVINKQDGLNSDSNTNGPELNEKVLLFNPYKDVRNKRGMEKSILGLAVLLRPSVGDISGFSNWEPTLYTNWYNEKTGRKINFPSVVKVNMIVDHLLLRTSKYFYKMTHSFFTSYKYVDKPGVSNSPTATNTNQNDESSPFYKEIDIKTNATNTIDSNFTASKANIKMEFDGCHDLNYMVTTTTATDDCTNCFHGNFSSSSSSSCNDNGESGNDFLVGYKHPDFNVVDAASSTQTLIYDCHNSNFEPNLTDSFKATAGPKDLPDDNYDCPNKNEVKSTLEQSVSNSNSEKNAHIKVKKEDKKTTVSKTKENHVKDANGSKTKNTKKPKDDANNNDQNPELEKQIDNKEGPDQNTDNPEPVVLRKSTRIKKQSSFVLYNESLDEMTPTPPSEPKSARKQPTTSNNKNSNTTKDNRDVQKHNNVMKTKCISIDDFLRNTKNQLYTLWDLYITIYFQLLDELRNGLRSDLNEIEEKLLFAILQSRLGYNSDLRETCVSMSKLPLSFHSLYASYQSAMEQNDRSENSTRSNTNRDANYPNDSSRPSSNDNIVHIPSHILNESDDRSYIFDERAIGSYIGKIRRHYDRLTKLNISRFDGKSDSDKLVINGWGWLLNHLIRNIKTSIYLNTKLLKIALLDENLNNNSSNQDDLNTNRATDRNVLESNADEIGCYNIKLSITYNENSTTSFNNAIYNGHIPNFTNYDFFDPGEPDQDQINCDSFVDYYHMANNINEYSTLNNDTNNPNSGMNDNMDLDTNEANSPYSHPQSDRTVENNKDNQRENNDENVKHIYAKYVLVTVPNSLLGEIEFEPKLDDNKLKSLKNYDMGFHNKIIMRFKPCEVFWPKNELQFNCLDSSFQFMNLDAYGKKGCLLAHSFPPFSKCFVKISKEILLMRCLDLLHKMFNLQTRIYPVQAFVTNWKSDPFARGSYSYPTKHARDEDVIHLKSPHPINNPKVLFSGEYISNSYYQCIDGSYDTSIRAAEDIYNLGLRNERTSVNNSTKSSKSTSKTTSSIPNNVPGNTYMPENNTSPLESVPNNPKNSNPDSPTDDANMDFYHREKYLDNILNNDHNDNFIGLPIPLPPKDLLGFYLTDGSDELFSDDNDFITFPTNFIKSVDESNRRNELKNVKRKYSYGPNESSEFDTKDELKNDKKIRKVLDEMYVPINANNSTTNYTNADNDFSEQMSHEDRKELELLLIIKAIFNRDSVNVNSLLEDYSKFNKILTYLIKNHHINKYTYYSNIIIISLLTTIFHDLKPSNNSEDSDISYKNEKDPNNSYDKLNEKILYELNNFKDVDVNIRNQQFSRKMVSNMSALIGLRHDYLCYHCLRGGEVILCDKEGCDSVWHYDCLPDSFKPATRLDFNDVRFENYSTIVRHESNTWNCPKCSNFPIERGEKSCSRDVQLYWIRRGYWWRVKAIISVSLQIYKRIQELTGH